MAVLLCGTLTPGLAGGPPFVTDDSETPRRRGWEINIPLIVARSRTLSQLQMPLFDLNYGLTDNFQLDLEIPVFRVDGPGREPATGLGDVMVGVKWRFLEETRSRPQIAIYPQVCLPTGKASLGLGAGAACYFFPVAAEKNFGKWTLYGNAAYVVQRAEGAWNYFYYGATVTREASDTVEIGVELFGNGATTAGKRPDQGFNFGMEWQISSSVVLLGSAGRSFHREGCFIAYAGIQILAGPNRRRRS